MIYLVLTLFGLIIVSAVLVVGGYYLALRLDWLPKVSDTQAVEGNVVAGRAAYIRPTGYTGISVAGDFDFNIFSVPTVAKSHRFQVGKFEMETMYANKYTTAFESIRSGQVRTLGYYRVPVRSFATGLLGNTATNIIDFPVPSISEPPNPRGRTAAGRN